MKLPNCYSPARRAARGFTLIELMIVISIVAILTTIAVTSYRAYVLRATRTEARMALLSIQAAQEKFFLQNNQYAQNVATAVAAPPAGLGVSLDAAGVTLGGHYTVNDQGVRTPADASGCWR